MMSHESSIVFDVQVLVGRAGGQSVGDADGPGVGHFANEMLGQKCTVLCPAFELFSSLMGHKWLASQQSIHESVVIASLNAFKTAIVH